VELADTSEGVELMSGSTTSKFALAIPLRRISQGLDKSRVILVPTSRGFAEPSWCRAEYEPLSAAEIESGNTAVIPVRLDDSDVPILLRAMR